LWEELAMLETALIVIGAIVGICVLGYLGIVVYTIIFDETGTA
jgi:hypothetical protein